MVVVVAGLAGTASVSAPALVVKESRWSKRGRRPSLCRVLLLLLLVLFAARILPLLFLRLWGVLPLNGPAMSPNKLCYV